MSLCIYLSRLLGRDMLVIEDVAAIPIDRIKHFDLNAPNGGCDNSVRIHTDDPDEDYTFAYKNADAIREFLRRNAFVRTVSCQRSSCDAQLEVNGDELPEGWTQCRCRDCGARLMSHVCPDHDHSANEFRCSRCGD